MPVSATYNAGFVGGWRMYTDTIEGAGTAAPRSEHASTLSCKSDVSDVETLLHTLKSPAHASTPRKAYQHAYRRLIRENG